MGSRIYLLVGEPQNSFKVNSDSGVCFADEILRRNLSLDYCDISQVDFRKSSEDYLSALPVQRVVGVRKLEKNPLDLGPKVTAKVAEYRVVLQRKDPPVDDVYAGHAGHFAKLPKEIIQMNNPAWTPVLSEHLLPADFPEVSIPTFLCESETAFVAKVRELNTKIVAKPKNLFSGIGITFFEKSASEEMLRQFWNQWKPQVIVQPYRTEIETIGDLRILMMNRQYVGSLLRKPDPKKLLGNLAQGATAVRYEPSHRQLKAAHAIAEALAPKGLLLLGLDFIGESVSEVNITCPTGVPGINQVMGIAAEKLIVDQLELLRGR